MTIMRLTMFIAMIMLTMFMTMTMLTMMMIITKMILIMMKGLRTRCSPGRPQWSDVLTEISENSPHQVIREIRLSVTIFPSQVTLFYCGAPQAGDAIQPVCDRLGWVFRKEIF